MSLNGFAGELGDRDASALSLVAESGVEIIR